MKFKSLKIMAVGSLLVFGVACNDESENNSTAAPSTMADSSTDTSSAATTAPAAMTPKTPATGKKGKASTAAPVDADSQTEKDAAGIYNRVEVVPAFAGGQSALDAYINDNIEYPQEAVDNNVEGTVNVQFMIDEKGNISNVKTVGNKLGYGLEEEAVKVVSGMPKWTAGKVKGKMVKTWRVLPITYRIEG